MKLSTFSILSTIFITAFTLAVPRPVLGADCGDILRNPVMDETDFSDYRSYYLDKIIRINENQSNASQQGADIGYEGFTLGYKDQENYAKQLNSSFNLSILSTERVHFRLFTGFGKIIDAWTGCMNR